MYTLQQELTCPVTTVASQGSNDSNAVTPAVVDTAGLLVTAEKYTVISSPTDKPGMIGGGLLAIAPVWVNQTRKKENGCRA